MTRRVRLGIILVHYHTPDLLGRAVDALRADLDASGLPAELIVVDNGSTAAQRDALRALPVRYLDAGGNLGYAAALNLGIARSEAEALVLMNPDVVVMPGCLAALMRALDDGADCAGPRFFWDEHGRFVLPPTEQRTRWAELGAALGEHGGVPGSWARRRWRRHARRHWLAVQSFETESLSGALLAVHRRALERIGPFDQRYRLYFEEHDWILRLRTAGLTAVHVPHAEAVHFFNQSAAQEPAARRWFAESQEIFFDRYYGAWFRRLLRALPRPRGAAPAARGGVGVGPPRLDLPRPSRAAEWPLWVEISSLARRFPAAATMVLEPAHGAFRLPPEIWRHLAPGRYFLTVVDARGQELAVSAFHRPAAQTDPNAARAAS